MADAKQVQIDVKLNELIPACEMPEEVPPDFPFGAILSKIPYSTLLGMFGSIVFGKVLDAALGEDGKAEINPQVICFDYKGYNVTAAVKLSVRKKTD